MRSIIHRNLGRGFALAVFAAVLAIPLGACIEVHRDPPSENGGEDSSYEDTYESEAETTRWMEEEARDIENRADEIRGMEGSEEDKIRAVQDLMNDADALIDASEERKDTYEQYNH